MARNAAEGEPDWATRLARLNLQNDSLASPPTSAPETPLGGQSLATSAGAVAATVKGQTRANEPSGAIE